MMRPALSRARSAAVVQDCFVAACELDVTALKPGNVRRGYPAHGMSAEDFLASARACAPDLCELEASIGQRVLSAIRSTRRVVHCNTNLGIVLLAAPLCRAARFEGELREQLSAQLAGLDRDDAVQVYEAIRLARPGGLGTVDQHDVGRQPAVGLREAMAAAAARDSVARQYARDFGDVFDLGLAQWRWALARFGDESTAATAVFLAFLSRWPDSLIARKYGAATAQAVSDRAIRLHSHLRSYVHAADIEPELLRWDAELRAGGLNPGTSADLTVATVLAAKLMQAV
jgi:triphosphoribosyl-dephospho-CoA synthase